MQQLRIVAILILFSKIKDGIASVFIESIRITIIMKLNVIKSDKT